MLVPEMVRRGYDMGFSAAITATSAVITPIIPPGISLILFACVIYLDKNQIDWKGQSAVAVINRQLETSVIGNSTVEALH